MVTIRSRRDPTQVRVVGQVVQGDGGGVVGWVEVRVEEGVNIFYVWGVWEEVQDE